MKFFILAITALFSLIACAEQSYHTTNSDENSKSAQQAPYVLLVSIDGFRWDYVEKYKPSFLSQWVKDSAQLTSLRPSFPTKTFPNHLSIVTGSYPQRHGILANRFYAPNLNQSYSLKDPKAVLNPDFYLVKPIWIIAEEQNMRTASYFWPGSEAPIAGKHPTYYQSYDHNQPHQARINTVVDWYKLPKERRPHFTTMYFHDVDSAGHEFGQDSPELIEAIKNVDDSLRDLMAKLAKLPIDVNVVIVSDHGMAQRASRQDFESLPQWLYDDYKVIGAGPIVHIYDTKSASVKLSDTVKKLNKQALHYQCYRYQDIPARFNASQSPRIGDIACLANKGWAIGTDRYKAIGDHGWSQFNTTDMDGIFYAKGPNFKNNVSLKTTENVHILPLLAHILSLNITHDIDGTLAPLSPLLK